MIHETMQDRIKRLLNERDIPIRDFAKMVGCSDVTITQILSSNSNTINKEHLIAICRSLSVSSDWLLGLTTSGPNSQKQTICLFISLPMVGRPITNIERHINKIKEYAKGIEKLSTYDLDFMHNLDCKPKDTPIHKPICYLSGALYKMSFCDCVIFGMGWEEARGCVIEHEVAKAYGVPIFYEGES